MFKGVPNYDREPNNTIHELLIMNMAQSKEKGYTYEEWVGGCSARAVLKCKDLYNRLGTARYKTNLN